MGNKDQIKSNYQRKSFLLHVEPQTIKDEIFKTLLKYFKNEKKVQQHLNHHFLKYLYVIDRVGRGSIREFSSAFKYYFVDYNSLFELTNHKRYPHFEKNRKTLAKLITVILHEAGFIMRNTYYSKKKGISFKYKLIKIKGYEPKKYPIEDLCTSNKLKIYLRQVDKINEDRFFLNSDVAKKMIEWQNKLDFSLIQKWELSRNHLLKYEEFFESPFQTCADSGRIYNSFACLPRTIRKNLMIGDERIGEADIANAQACFLVKVVLDKLKEKGERIHGTTTQFQEWCELGKGFELLNGMENFQNPQRRESFKKQFWALINDENRHENRYPIIENSLFRIPQIINIVREIKMDDNGKMSFLLHREEARTIHACYRSIMHKLDSSPIHDAIFFPISKREMAVNSVLDKLKQLGVRCTLKWNCFYEKGKIDYGFVRSFVPSESQKLIMYENSRVFNKENSSSNFQKAQKQVNKPKENKEEISDFMKIINSL